ncbi:MAG: WXG100 family type VII secretion target [Oscillibacter sp.]|nr:WXG100 family type VII secretion target [Oscillibacter sp.]MBQ7680900.1 WXG100 family type VII secretion target [Oscillibacter sp.]MBQ9616850.1 WXG100 family type VII secretion target [Oscillibacter sp.]
MAAVRVSVSSEAMRQTASEMRALLRTMRLRAGRIRDISARTRGYWQGDAGQQDREGYRDCAEELIDAARRLDERAVGLLRLAGLYRETDEAVAGINTTLRTDSILVK